jgi:hypothetical protein
VLIAIESPKEAVALTMSLPTFPLAVTGEL